MTFAQQASRLDLRRLMAGDNRRIMIQHIQHRIIDHHRMRIFDAAQHDAMPHRLQVIAGRLLMHEIQNDLDGLGPTLRRIPLALIKNGALMIANLEMRLAKQTFDLAAKNQPRLVVIHRI